MINICLIYDMDNIPHEIIRQTAGNSGVVNGCKFTLYNQENIDQLPGECDALIVLNTPFTTIRTRCHANLIYLVSQEAPNDRYKWHRNSFKHFSQVYTQWPLKKKNVVPSHGFLSWYIDKSYDELQTMDLNEPRKNDVAYIGNKESILIGQVKRNEFVEELNRVFANDNNLSFDLLGRTYGAPVDNKCDKLAEYKYALAIENTIVDHYWTEKISDIFLAGCLPFYIGPDNIHDYFEPESLIVLDFDDIGKSIGMIKNAIKGNEYEKRKEAVLRSREKIMKNYNLFYAFSDLIRNNMENNVAGDRIEVTLPENYWGTKTSLIQRIKNKLG